MLIGKVGKPYGILGWITIFSFTERKEKIFDYLPWFFLKQERWIKIQLQGWKKHKNNFIIHVHNVSDRSQSSEFTNSNIIISKHKLPKLKKNEYYWNNIINYQIFNTNQCYLGKVISLIRTQYNDILVVKNQLKICKNKILIPFIEKKIIKNIDTKHQVITVKWN